MDSMYEILMGLPLFKGVSYANISKVVESTKFHFLKYLDGETLVTAGETCTHVKFIISGKARLSIANADGRFKVSQTLSAPDVIAPDVLATIYASACCSSTSLPFPPPSLLTISLS